jgi:PAS domain S-box-containing protein
MAKNHFYEMLMDAPVAYARLMLKAEVGKPGKSLFITEVNKSFTDLAAKEAEQLVNADLSDIFKELSEQILNFDENPERQIFFKNPQTQCQFSCKVYPAGDSVFDILIAFEKDVSALLKHEEDSDEPMFDCKSKYKQLFETMVLGVVYQNAEGKILTANPAAERILGLSLDQLQGRTSIDSDWGAVREDGSDFPGEDHPAMVSLRTGKPVSNQIMGIQNPKEGRTNWILINAHPEFRHGENQPFRVFATFLDITESVEAKSNLIQEEEKFRVAFQFSPDLVSISRMIDGKYVDVNEQFINLSGYTREEIIGKTSHELNFWPKPGDRSRLIENLGEFKFAKNLELEFKLKGNRSITGLVSFSVIDIDGEPHLLSFIKDITERKKTQEHLKLLLDRIDLATETAGLGVWEWDVTQNTLVWDKQMLNLYGLDHNESGPTFEQWLAFIHRDDRNRLEDVLQQVLDGKYSYDAEFRIISTDGIEKYIRATGKVIRDSKGHARKMIGVNYDVTEERLSKAALLESQQLYKQVISASSEGIILMAGDGRILTWNPAAERIFATPSTEAVGRYVKNLGHIIFNEEGLLLNIDEYPSMITLKTGKPIYNSILRVVNIKQETFLIQLNTNPLFGPDGKNPYRVLVTFSDITGLKAAEVNAINAKEKAEEQEAILRAIIENAPFEVWARDENQAGILENQNAFKHFGSILGKKPEDFDSSEETLTLWKSNNQRVLAGETIDDECIYEVNGERRIFQQIIAPIYNQQKIEGIVGFNIDITEKKDAENTLRHREQIFKKAQQLAGLGSFEYIFSDNSGVLSENLYRLLGVSGEMSPFKNALETVRSFIVEDDIPAVQKYYSDNINSQNKFDIVFRIRRRDGAIRSFHIRADLNLNESGSPSSMTGLVQDITERLRGEEALKQSEARLSSFMNYVPAMIMIKDRQFRPFYANHNLRILFPYESWHGKTPAEIFPEIEVEFMKLKDKEAMKSGYVAFEDIWKDRSGNEVLCYIQKFRISIPGAEPLLGEIITDITYRKKAEDEIRSLNTSLEKRIEDRTSALVEANKELEAFAYSVSHDLRAPLRAVDGFARILLEDFSEKIGEEGKKVCEVIQSNSARMGQLIDDLLAFSRTGRSELNYSQIDMQKLAKAAYLDIADQAQRKSISFDCESLPLVIADHSMIKQVWINLISNAVKFSSRTISPSITINGWTEENYCYYQISDNGVGFNMKYADKLFGVFQRLHNQKEFEGTGAGLAIVKRIIHKHGGDINATSELNAGATFVFKLPVDNRHVY